ncbi:MAG: cytochrome c biogenesis protein CcsA [Actinobacteria bacterium]|nr:cytochrome c biogenesis protein CcsA [Actinomycetota bacterium]
MGYTDYINAREFTQGFEGYLIIILLTLSVLLVFLSIMKSKHIGRVLAGSVVVLLLGFLLLAWFHLKIYSSIELINPANGFMVGRVMAPLWIENEKLYFWAVLLGLFTYLIYRGDREGLFSRWLNIVFAGFVLLTMLTSNPLASPLPGLHEEISGYQAAMSEGDLHVQMQIFQRFYGRVTYFYNAIYMWVHPPLLFISYAALIVSFLASVFMLIKKREEIYDKIAYSYAKLGYILLTFGMLVSYPWALKAWANEPWWWSPKINMSLMMWMFYTAYLHSRLHLHRRGMWNTTAILGILCFMTLVLTYITTYVVPGVHSYG